MLWCDSRGATLDEVADDVLQEVLPTGAKAVDVQTQILIAESIIVGDVPDSFINIPDPDSALNFAE